MKMRTMFWLALASSVAGCGKGGDAAAPTLPPPGGGNHDPTVNLDIDPTHLAYRQTATLTVSASDPDGDQVTFTWSAVLGTVLSSGPTATSASFTAGNHWGQASVTVTASDGKGGTAQATALTYIRNPSPPGFALTPVASTVSGCTGFALQFTPGEDVLVSALYIWPRDVSSGCNQSRSYSPPRSVSGGQPYVVRDPGCLWPECLGVSILRYEVVISGRRPEPDGGSFTFDCPDLWPSSPGSCN